MTSDVERYPLSWPASWRRTLPHARRLGTFGRMAADPGSSWRRRRDLSIADGRSRLLEELARLHATHVVISTNVPTRQDGLPYSNARPPADPGVAVYFTLGRAPRVLACDRYRTVADNLAAIAGHVSALRAIERYGVGSLEQAFAGYTALPPEPSSDWHLVLGVSPSASLEDIETAYRAAALKAHPDRGGSHDAMTRLNTARMAAKRARGAA